MNISDLRNIIQEEIDLLQKDSKDWTIGDLVKLKECEVYRLDIMADSDTQTKYSVTAIPTVIIFDNGIEKERFLPNIMFQLEVDKKVIQNSVDTIILSKFQ